jgi:hypothetical protein
MDSLEDDDGNYEPMEEAELTKEDAAARHGYLVAGGVCQVSWP